MWNSEYFFFRSLLLWPAYVLYDLLDAADAASLWEARGSSRGVPGGAPAGRWRPSQSARGGHTGHQTAPARCPPACWEEQGARPSNTRRHPLKAQNWEPCKAQPPPPEPAWMQEQLARKVELKTSCLTEKGCCYSWGLKGSNCVLL